MSIILMIRIFSCKSM